MKVPRIRSIRRRLVLIILAVTTLTSGAGFIVVGVRDIGSYRTETREHGSLQAQLVAHSCVSALTFDDPAGAEVVLSSLAALPDFRLAVLFDEQGRPFARHATGADDVTLLELHGEPWARMSGAQLHLQEPVLHRERRLGTLYLVFGVEELRQKERLRAISLAVVLLVLVAAAYALARYLQKQISVPILNLAGATERISAGGDLSMPLERQGDDEIGLLYDRFGQMLEQLKLRQQERDRVEEDLRQSEVKYRSVFDGVSDAIVIHDRHTGRIVDVNQKALEMYGLTREQMLAFDGRGTQSGPPTPLSPAAAEYFERAGSGIPQRFEWRLLRRDGDLLWLDVGLRLNRIVDQEQILASVRDITDRKRVEDELTSTRNYLRNVFDSLTSMLISIDPQGRVTQWNSAAEAAIGVAWRGIGGRLVWDVVPFLAPYRSHLMSTLATRRPVHLHGQQIPGEQRRVLDIDIFPIVQDGSQGAAIRIDDVTELALKDEQLRQAQKMETIGTLAGGLAHDFNNYLGGIVGRLTLLQHRLRGGARDPSVFENDLKIMEEAARRAAEMVQQLLGLSRKREMSLQPVELNRTIEHVLKIYHHTLDKSVDVRSLPSHGPALVQADPAQIEQVLLNLCINAAHAMTIMRESGESRGGVLSIAVQKVHADASFAVRHPGMGEGGYWCIRISDTGVGIAAEVLPKVFDPFFSGKAAGQGSGLGLSIVYTIVHQHGGFIDVYSELGVGSTFSVYLPAQVGDVPLGEPETAAEALPSGSGLVLVVDDEEVVRQTACEILEECGYRVLTAVDGEDGLRMFRQQHAAIDAVLLDMAMPKMSGKECYAEMKRIEPGVRVILASGFKQDQRVAELMSQGILGFLQKPYSMLELARAMSALFRGELSKG